jgi:hypothetical protein
LTDFEPYSSDEGADEVMTDGGLPRWLGLVGALVVVALVVALVRRNGAPGSERPAPVPKPSPTPAPPNVAYDLASGPLGTWLLETGRLAEISGTRVTRSVSLRDVPFPDRSLPVLALDTAAHRIWVVLTNAAPSRMVEYDTGTLRKVRDVRWAPLVQNAAALDGHLYVTTDFGVADLAPGARRPRFVPGLSGALGRMAVDPSRSRLIVMDLGYPTDLWTYRPGGSAAQSSIQLPFVRGTLGVVAGRIWVSGFGMHAGVLARLDPGSLRPVQHAADRSLGSGVNIVGTGSTVFWVRGANGLACLDAASGRVEQTWQIDFVNAVTSSRGGAIAATPTGVLGLIMSGCAG